MLVSVIPSIENRATTVVTLTSTWRKVLAIGGGPSGKMGTASVITVAILNRYNLGHMPINLLKTMTVVGPG